MTKDKKNWTVSEDDLIRTLVAQMGSKPKWTIVAEKVNKREGPELNYGRSAKQCRERWHNKLNPNIMRQEWTDEQVLQLFSLHNRYGNKWSVISGEMSGRTDNCVKNKFYSTLRKGVRKINKYIVNLKRRLKVNKNVCIKEFKDVVLNKLIKVADGNYDDSLDVKANSRNKAQRLSRDIKFALIKVADNQDEYLGHVEDGIADGDYELEETLIKNIQEFCRNCKRKKSKKRSEDEDYGDVEDSFSVKLEIDEENKSKENESQAKKCNVKKQASTKTDFGKDDKMASVKQTRKKITWNVETNPKNEEDLEEQFLTLEKYVQRPSSYNARKLQSSQSPNKSQTYNKQSKQTIGFSSIDECLNEGQGQFVGGIGMNFLSGIPSVPFEKVGEGRIDDNNIIGGIFKTASIPANPSSLDNSNPFNMESSNPNFFGEKSGSLGFLSRSRNIDAFDPNGIAISSSYSSSTNNNRIQMEIMRSVEKSEKGEKKEDLQKSSGNFHLTDSVQIDDFFRRRSQLP